MNDTAKAIVSSFTEAFHGASGPAKFKYPESGWWFDWEGKDIAKALLDLDPVDIQHDDIIKPIDGSFVPAWANDEGLLRLVERSRFAAPTLAILPLRELEGDSFFGRL